MALYRGEVVLFHTGKPEKAREYSDRLPKANALEALKVKVLSLTC